MPLPGGHTLPLTYDAYTALTLFAPGPPIAGSLGVLGAGGGGVAAFGLPPGLSPSLVGLTIYHAFLVVAWRRRG